MTDILKTIEGRDLGMTVGKRLIASRGFITGHNGNQMTSDQSPFAVTLFDDFTGAAVSSRWASSEGTDGATSNIAVLAGGIGGVLRITTGHAGTGLAADGINITQALQWQASNGDLAFQCRIKANAWTTCNCFVGFTDLAASLEAPIESAVSGNNITTNASDAVGFMLDSRMTAGTVWWLTGVAADTDATKQNSGIGPTLAQYQTLRVTVTTAGVATFYINGNQVGTSMTGAVTPATDLTPVIYVGKTSITASMLLDVDYVYVSMARADDGGAV